MKISLEMLKLIGIVGVVAAVFVAAGWLSQKSNSKTTGSPVLAQKSPSNAESSEIGAIKQIKSLEQQVVYYQHLIDRVGPVEAQIALYKSGLPFDGQTHLLNHTVGDFLYEKYGTDGLIYCRDYFLSSCFHGFVIQVIAKDGADSLIPVMDKCFSVGPGTATQCAHGIGHGFLAFDGYKNLTQALADCDQVQAKSPNFPAINCYDGVFMENIYAIHNDGKPSPDRWLKESDLAYPCNDPRIDQKYIQACWMDQPFWMTQQYHNDIQKVGAECLKLTNTDYQRTCFDALARQIHPMTQGSVDTAFQMCGAMPPNWVVPCIYTIVGSSFSVGDRQLPFEICSRVLTVDKNGCYGVLTGVMKSYVYTADERKSLCDQIPADYRQSCFIN